MTTSTRRHFGKSLVAMPFGVMAISSVDAQDAATTKEAEDKANAARLNAVKNDASYLNTRRSGKIEYSRVRHFAAPCANFSQ